MTEQMIKLYRDVSEFHGYALGNIAGILLAIGMFLGPGLIIGAIITQYSVVIILSIVSLLALISGILLNELSRRLEKLRFLNAASVEGISRSDAETFLNTVDWDSVFPEYD